MLGVKENQPKKKNIYVTFSSLNNGDDIGTSIEQKQVRKVSQLALEIILDVLQYAIPRARGGDDKLVKKYFHLSTEDEKEYSKDIDTIEQNFIKINTILLNTNLQFSFSGFLVGEDKTNAAVFKKSHPNHIVLFRGKKDPDGNFFRDDDIRQACIIIHELTHLYVGTHDYAYSHQNIKLPLYLEVFNYLNNKNDPNDPNNFERLKQDDWLEISKEERLENADSYEEFAYAVQKERKRANRYWNLG